MAWVIVAGVAALVPALVHGHALGPYDLLDQFGLSHRTGVAVHNPFVSDQIAQMIPWTDLSWTQVHHGHLPLWNPYSALGMPLAFNWQSAPFGLPALVGYLFPLQLAYTAGVVVTLLVAGTGVYVLGKTLRLSIVSCALAGTVYEISGPFFGWLGWPVASVMSWAGWLFAATLLVVRGRHRARSVALFALVVAAAVYSGQPDSLIVLATVTAVFAVVLLAQRTTLFGGSGPLLRPVTDLAVAMVAGAALGAPLILPGFQLLSRSVRSNGGSTLGSQQGLPLSNFFSLFVGYDGLWGMTSAAIGAIVVVLVVTGAVVRWRRADVRALVVTVVVVVLLAFAEPLIFIMNALPGLHAVRWPRAITGVSLLLAVLAGVGMDALLRGHSAHTVRRWLGAGFAVAAVAFLGIVTLGHPPAVPVDLRSGFIEGFKGRDLVGGTIGVIVGLVGAATLAVAHRRRGPSSGHRVARFGVEFLVGVLLLVGETVALVIVAATLWTSSSGFSATTAEATLTQTVGSGLVGLGAGAQTCHSRPGLGLLPDTNVLSGVHEMTAYDPLISQTYFKTWRFLTGENGGLSGLSTFCPQVATVATARQFGIGYVLESRGSPGPAGALFDRHIGDQDLYRIPGAAAAILAPIGPGGALPPNDAPGTPVAVTYPTPSVWRLSTSAATEQVLRLHLTDDPGWHATIDGHPLALEPFAGLMIEARIPPGHHTVTVSYWPTRFTLGLVLAAVSVLGLSAGLVVAATRRRRSGGIDRVVT